MCPLYCRFSSRSTPRYSGRKWEIRNWSSGKQDLRFIFREIHTLPKMCQKCFRKCWQCNTFNLASESFTLKLAHNILGAEILLLFSGILKNFIQKGDKFKSIKIYWVGLAVSCFAHSSATLWVWGLFLKFAKLLQIKSPSSHKLCLRQVLYNVRANTKSSPKKLSLCGLDNRGKSLTSVPMALS